MPVSNPSAFPPPRSPDQIVSINAGENFTGQRAFLAGSTTGDNSSLNDVVLLGHAILPDAVTDVFLDGTTAVGSFALNSVRSTGNVASGSGLVAIGFNAAASAQYVTGSVFIGTNVAKSFVSSTGADPSRDNTVVGCNAAALLGSNPGSQHAMEGCVIIGAQAAQSVANSIGVLDNCIVIGANSVTNVNTTLNGCIVIGTSSVPNLGATIAASAVIIIGNGCTFADGTTACVYIGDGMVIAGQSHQNVAVGAQIGNTGSSFNVVLGDQANGLTNSSNVVIGYNAGANNPAASSKLLIETNTGAGANTRLVWGDFAAGNLCIGNSSAAAANDVLLGTNTLKLLNGTVGGSAPVGGGYFYIAAGALHWVGSSGTDTTVAPA